MLQFSECISTEIEGCLEYKENGDCLQCENGKFPNADGDMCVGKSEKMTL